MENLDSWKDDYLARAEITQEQFRAAPDEHKTWLIENKHIFYNHNGNTILNLVHSKYKHMARMLRLNKCYKK